MSGNKRGSTKKSPEVRILRSFLNTTSKGITLPSFHLRDLGWKDGDFLQVKREGKSLVVRKLVPEE